MGNISTNDPSNFATNHKSLCTHSGVASITGTQFFSQPSQVMLTVTNNGKFTSFCNFVNFSNKGFAPVQGNIKSYQLAYMWTSPSTYATYNLALTTVFLVCYCITNQYYLFFINYKFIQFCIWNADFMCHCLCDWTFLWEVLVISKQQLND